MIDFIRIGFNTKNESKVFISAQGRFEYVTLSYEVYSEKEECFVETKFVNSDLLVTENINKLMSSLYKFYNEKSSIIENLNSNGNLYCALDNVVEQFPFLERTEMAELEFGFNFENPNSTEIIKKKTILLFMGSYSSLSTTLLPSSKGQKDNKDKCSDMTVKIKFKFKSNWVTI